MLLSDAVDLVGKLTAAFPNGGQSAGRSYIGALAAVLCDYPKSVAARCADPLRGVARETRFMPTVADLVAWCERETQAMRTPVEREDRDGRILREMAERRDDGEYWQRARLERPTFDDLKAKYGPTWGLGQHKTDDHAADDRHAAAIDRANQRAYARMEGGTVSAGIPITQALLSSNLVKPAPKAAEMEPL